MVRPFQFARVPKLIFKNGVIADLPSIIKSFGTRIVLVTGKKSFIRSVYAEKMLYDFDNMGISSELITVSGEPSPELIDESVGLLNKENFDLVVGIGGGSVLDAGKAISGMIYRSESITDFLEGVGTKEHPGTKIPFIAVPTTSGTGSEATKNAVISKIGKSGFKKSLRHDNFVPDVALIDPQLTLDCPKNITAASGMDCFTQITEAYLSNNANPYTDALALEGLKEISASLLRTYTNGDDIGARSGMSFAALTSGICIANAGLGVVHGFASSIGGMYDIPHGLVCGTLMAKANEINVRELRKLSGNQPSLRKYALLGELFLDERGKSDDYYIDGFIAHLNKLTSDLQLQGLKGYGVEAGDIEMICSVTEIKNNPVNLGLDELSEIITSRL